MSFHTEIEKELSSAVEFHETKRERKYYEGKKQKALRYLDHTITDFVDQQISDYQMEQKLEKLRKLVNDI